MEYLSHSIEETEKIARDIAQTARPGDVFLLSGDLGAGKTTFSKGFLSHFGIDQADVVSPTFTLMQLYDIDGEVRHLVHIDTYRMEEPAEFLDIGALDYVGQPDTISLIEWPDKIMDLLSPVGNTYSIHITTPAPDMRHIRTSHV